MDGQVVFDERIGHRRGEGSGKSHITVRADERHLYAVRHEPRIPELLVESVCSSMKRITAVVHWNLIAMSVETEDAFGDAVQPDALDHLTSTGRVGKMWSPRDCIDLEHIAMGAVPRRRIGRQILRSQEGILAEQAACLASR